MEKEIEEIYNYQEVIEAKKDKDGLRIDMLQTALQWQGLMPLREILPEQR